MAASRAAARGKARKAPVQARGLSPSSYVAPAVYAREVERVFAREWLCIGRVEDVVRPGDYVSVDIAGEPLLMLRDQEGALRVFSRICRHRAMSIVEGAGNARSFVCPYHAWTYDLDGRLLEDGIHHRHRLDRIDRRQGKRC